MAKKPVLNHASMSGGVKGHFQPRQEEGGLESLGGKQRGQLSGT